MPIAERMINMVAGMEMVKKMFEEGARLKSQYGMENVFDFSLGNPDIPPPPEFKKVLGELLDDRTVGHGYTPNAGFPRVRQAVAEHLGGEHGMRIPPDLVVMTVGAAGALNDVLNAVVNPGEEILVPSPYFIGYDHYAFLAQAAIKTVPTDERFHLDTAAIEAAGDLMINCVIYRITEDDQEGYLVEGDVVQTMQEVY